MTDRIAIRTQVREDMTINLYQRRTDALPRSNPKAGIKPATTTSRHHVTPISEQDAGMKVAETRLVWNDTDADTTSLQNPETIPFTTTATRTFPTSSTDSPLTVI